MTYELEEFDDGHPLVELVRDVFGLSVASLLLAGYGRERPERVEHFEFTEKQEGGDITWKVWVEGGPLPYGYEPLVLAALLKFLLLRIKLDETYASDALEFSMDELLRNVSEAVIPMTADAAEMIIVKYMNISYRAETWDEGWTQKHKKPKCRNLSRLVVGYTSPVYQGDWDGPPSRLFYRASLSTDLVHGLKNGKFTFAGMQLGAVRPVR